MGCTTSKIDPTGAVPPQFRYEPPREIDYIKLRKFASFFAQIDCPMGPDGVPSKYLLFGRSRGGFNIKMMYALEPSTGKVWKFDFLNVEDHVDAVSAYTIITDSIARSRAEVLFKPSAAAASDASKAGAGNGARVPVSPSAASVSSGVGAGALSSGQAAAAPSLRFCARFQLGSCDPEQLILTDPSGWPSVISLSQDQKWLTIQFALLKLYSPTWRDIWMEYVLCLNDYAPKLQPTLLEEIQPAHETIVIHSDSGEVYETRRPVETEDDRMLKASRARVEQHIQVIEKEIAKLRAMAVDLQQRSDAGEIVDTLPDLYEGRIRIDSFRSPFHSSSSAAASDDEDYPDEPDTPSQHSTDDEGDNAEPSQAPSPKSPSFKRVGSVASTSQDKDHQHEEVKQQPEPVQVKIDPKSEEEEKKLVTPATVVLPPSPSPAAPVLIQPSSSGEKENDGKFNKWRNLEGSLIARKYGYDTALPIVRVLALLEDLRVKFEAHPGLLDGTDLKIQDLLYVEDVLSKNRQFNPEFISTLVAKSAKEADEETGQFLVNELAPYQRSAMQTLGTSLTVVRSVMVFKSKLRRSLGTAARKIVRFSVLDYFPKIGPSVDLTSNWDFDVFAFNRMTLGRPLFAMSVHYIEKYDLVTKLGLDTDKLSNFLREIEENYLNNPYHNRIHGTDVLQTMMFFLESGGYIRYLNAVDILAVIISAAGHDLGHPGLANPFQIKTISPLALRFNNQSVLEMFHCSFLFEILLKEHNNFLAVLDFESKLQFRDMVISLVLATDMGRNFEYLGKFQTTLIRTDRSKFAPSNPDELKLMLQLFIKAADVSNPSKPANVYLLWVDRVMEEFYRQGDREKQLGLPISPFMNRETTDVGKCQVGFMDFITLPLYECLANFDPVFLPCLQQLMTNKNFWNDMMKQGLVQKELGRIKDMVAQQQVLYQQHEASEKGASTPTAASTTPSNANPGASLSPSSTNH